MAKRDLSSTKKTIRICAEKMFRERGYAATGMRELAKEVGIEAPSIYNHYTSKDELLLEICAEMADRFIKAFDEATAGEKSYAKNLRLAIKAHIGVIANHIAASGVYFSEWIFLKGSDLTAIGKLKIQYENKFQNLLMKGMEKGDFREMNTRLATLVIFSALNATDELNKSKEKLTQEEIADSISAILLKGIRK